MSILEIGQSDSLISDSKKKYQEKTCVDIKSFCIFAAKSNIDR